MILPCHSCGARSGPGDRFCTNCGASLKIVCENCGSSSEPGSRFCRDCGASLAPLPPGPTLRHALHSLAESGGERKRLTILFADLKNSTALIENDEAEAAMQRLAPVIAHMKEAVQRYDGIVSRVMGDGVMALFGTPKPLEDHAIRSCLAGLAMQEQMVRLNNADFQIRVGIHTGEVVVRAVRDALVDEFSADGPAVHIANRMEQMSDAGGILVSAETFREARQFIQAELLGPRAVKGLSDLIEIYRVTGLRNAPASEIFRNRGPLEPLAGREAQILQLERALADAEQGRGSVVGVVGDAGIGKSRLCFEFVETCRRRNIAVLEARVAPFGRSTPFQPILDLLRDYFGVRVTDDKDGIRKRITGRLGQLSADPSMAALLFDFMGLSTAAGNVDPGARKAKLVEFIRGLARQGSVEAAAVVLIEDLHWLDAGSEDFIEALADAVYGTRTLLLLNFRPGYSAAWMQHSHYRQINLDPLGAGAFDALIAHLVGDDPSTRDLRRDLAERSRGNPFFLEELVRAMVDAGGLEGSQGAYRSTGAITLSKLPPTVQGVLSARIDNLDASSKRLLQVAAVIGREIPIAVLTEVAALSAAELDHALRTLRRSELLYEMPLSEKGFLAFRHPLIQEVAYRGLLTDKRRGWHGAVAKSIVAAFADRLDEFAALLAYHLEEAGDLKGAAQAHMRSAIWMGANDARQALAAWRKVCVILGQTPPDRETDFMRMMASGQVVNFAWREGVPADEARPYFETASQLALGAKNMRANALIHAAYGRILAAAGSADEYVAKIREAQALSTGSTDKSLSVTLDAVLCHALRLSGRLTNAIDVNTSALARADELGTFERQMLGFDIAPWLLVMRGQTLVTMGRGDEARSDLDRVIQMEPSTVDPTHYAIPSLAYIDWAWATGDAALADLHAARAVDIAERAGSPYLLVYARSSLALAHLVGKRLDEAIAVLSDTLAFARSRKAGLENEARMLADLAQAHLRRGEAERATPFADEAIAIAQGRNARAIEGYARLLRAAALRSSDPKAAAGEKRTADALLGESGAALFVTAVARLGRG
jgi:adenylate cyclase